MAYVLAMYYQRCILYKEDSDTVRQICRKLSKLDQRKADYLATVFTSFFNDNPKCSIEAFIAEFARVFMNQEANEKSSMKLTSDAVVSRWMYGFGPGTVFGLEFFPAFAAILSDCYVGAYINQQKYCFQHLGLMEIALYHFAPFFFFLLTHLRISISWKIHKI